MEQPVIKSIPKIHTAEDLTNTPLKFKIHPLKKKSELC